MALPLQKGRAIILFKPEQVMKKRKNPNLVKIAGHEVLLKEHHSWSDMACALPAVLLLAVLTYYPLCKLVQISFTNWNLLKPTWDYVGWKNWNWLFTSTVGKRYMFNTLKVTAIYTVCHIGIVLILGMLLALLFNKLTKPYSAMRAIIFMPRYIAMSTCGIIFLWMLNTDYGIINIALRKMGLDGIPWLEDRTMAMVSVLVLTGWHGVGYGMMIYLSAMLGISRDYFEAAELDGANGFQTFRYITLPLLSPTTLFLLITTFISSMKVFQSVDVLTSGGPYNSTEVFVYYIYRLAFVDFRIDRASVNALLFFVILLVVTASTIRITNKNVHYDA